MAWDKAVEAIGNAVAETAKAVQAFGPNDEGKAVNAAKKAGDKAKNMVKKSYPKIETKAEFKRKIQPLIDAGELDGVTDKATYNFKRGQILEDAYKQAYDEVMSLYKQRLENEANAIQVQNAQESLTDDLLNETSKVPGGQDVMSKSTSGMGCSLFAVLLAGGGSYGVYELGSYLLNFL